MKLPENPRILITRTDRIGDLVVSTPVFQALREKFPQSYLAACIFSEHRELVQGNPFLNEVILYEKSGHEKNWLGQFCFAKKIRKKKFDLVIHLHATNRMHIMSWLAGIPVRIGYDRRAAWALTNIHPYDKKEGLDESAYLFHLVSELIAQPTIPMQPFVPISERNRLSVSNLIEHHGLNPKDQFAVIHPSASDVTKMWPAGKFAALIKSFPQKDLKWIAVGGPETSFQIEKIQVLSGIKVLNLCGQLSLGMLAALFEKSKIVISNDSGPAHIAAAVGVPTVSIFGRWQPGLNAERWRPLGKKASIVKPEIESIPVEKRKFSYIDEITVAQVMTAVQQVLA